MTVPLMLAPMAELSHRPLRELIEGFGGCDSYFTEMISAAAFCARGPFESWYADAGPKPEKTVFQLVGSEPEKLAQAGSLLDKMECAGIDINMGCSAPAITRTRAGVRWMESVEKAGQMISMVRKAVKHRLSVKLRTGLQDDFEYLVRFCLCLEQEGVEMITLHPRTAREKFRRNCRWEYIPALRHELKIPVTGNGDINSAEEIIRRSHDCDAIMIGRLAIRRPWIFAETRALETGNNPQPVTITLICQTGLKFLELLSRYQPPEFHLSRAKRFFGYFCDNLKWGNYLKNLVNREQNLAGIERVWKSFFEDPEYAGQ